MGLFKSYRQITSLTKEIAGARGDESQSQRALAGFQAASANMAKMANQVSGSTPGRGTPGTATITGVRNTGQLINMQPILQIELVVQVPGRVPMPITRDELMAPHLLARAQVGASVGVIVGSAPDDITIDWTRG